MTITRLDRVDAGGTSPADRAYALSREIVRLTATVVSCVPPDELPRLRSHAAGDQLWVVGEQLRAVAEGAGPAQRQHVVPLMTEVAEQLRALRRST